MRFALVFHAERWWWSRTNVCLGLCVRVCFNAFKTSLLPISFTYLPCSAQFTFHSSSIRIQPTIPPYQVFIPRCRTALFPSCIISWITELHSSLPLYLFPTIYHRHIFLSGVEKLDPTWVSLTCIPFIICFWACGLILYYDTFVIMMITKYRNAALPNIRNAVYFFAGTFIMLYIYMYIFRYMQILYGFMLLQVSGSRVTASSLDIYTPEVVGFPFPNTHVWLTHRNNSFLSLSFFSMSVRILMCTFHSRPSYWDVIFIVEKWLKFPFILWSYRSTNFLSQSIFKYYCLLYTVMILPHIL